MLLTTANRDVQAPAGDQACIWPNPLFGTHSNDWQAFQRRLLAVCAARGFLPEILGHTDHEPIYALTRRARRKTARSILVASGFHGEEPAGPWGLLHALETLDMTLLDAVHLSALPLVNVSGFSQGRRLNHKGENPNRGFLPLLDGATASEEGAILMRHQARLVRYGRDGALCCHEDTARQQAYIYANERGDAPGPLALKLRNCNAGFFPLHPDGAIDGCLLADGIVFNHPDSSFEAWLFAHGATHTYCTETPGQCAFEDRLLANAAMVSTFIEHHIS